MKKKIFLNTVIFFIIQAFLFLDMPLAADLLSPSIKFDGVEFIKNFNKLVSARENKIDEELGKMLKFPPNSLAKIFITALNLQPKLGIRQTKPGDGNSIPVEIGNFELIKNMIPNMRRDYTARLLLEDGYPVALDIFVGYLFNYLIDFSELTNFQLPNNEHKKAPEMPRSGFKVRPKPINRWGINNIFVLPEEYPPTTIHTQSLIDEALKALKEIEKTKPKQEIKILDFGCGPGIVGLALAENGYEVVSIDNREASIVNSLINATALGLNDKMRVIKSNFFENLSGEKFDMILFFPPGGPTAMARPEGVAEIKDPRKFLQGLFSDLKDHLTETGALYMVVIQGKEGDKKGDEKLGEDLFKIEDVIKKNNLESHPIRQHRSETAFESFDILKIQSANPSENNLVERIRQKIEHNPNKRITFAEYMDSVLYDQELGYYMKDVEIRRLAPKELDKFKGVTFTTFAEDEYFGRGIAKQIIEMWEKMGKPDKFSIVEMGAGNGTLAKNILKHINEKNPELFGKLEYVIVEISQKLIEKQQENLQKFEGVVRWIEGTALNLSSLQNIEGVFLSNELPDAFPVHRVKIIEGEAKEIYVTYKEGRFQDEIGELSSADLKEYMYNLQKEVILPEGLEIAVNLQMRKWQEEIAKSIKRVFVITIDYGDKLEKIIEDQLKYKRHSVWNKDYKNIKQIYERTGEIDITSAINFSDLAQWGEEQGLRTLYFILQRDFILKLLGEEEDISTDRYLHLFWRFNNLHFKVLIQSKGIQKTELLNWQKYFPGSSLLINDKDIAGKKSTDLRSAELIEQSI